MGTVELRRVMVLVVVVLRLVVPVVVVPVVVVLSVVVLSVVVRCGWRGRWRSVCRLGWSR